MNVGISAAKSGYWAGSLTRIGAGPAAHTEIVELSPTDVDRAVALYREAFPAAFFARLGRRFLAEYYAAHLTSPRGVVLAVYDEGCLLAVLAGNVDACHHRQHILRRHGRRLALRGALALLVRPHLALSFAHRRLGWYVRKLARGLRPASSGVAPGGSGAVAVLDHVLVVPSARGRGLGHRLVEQFVGEAGRRGASRAVLVTRAENTPARLLYENLGWTASGEHPTRDGTPVVTYEYALGTVPRPNGQVARLPAAARPVSVVLDTSSGSRSVAGSGGASR